MRPRVVTGLVLVMLLSSACGGDGGGGTSTSTPLSSTSTAPAEPSGIADPQGDAGVPESMGYLDAISADVSKEGSTFVFAYTLAAPIPSTVEVPEPYDALLWSFCVDTDPSATPFGYPFEVSTGVPCEFIVMESSEGGALAGSLIDRRPLLDGKKAATTSIPLSISGTGVVTSVPASSLGNPASLTWIMATTELTLPLGNDDFVDMDEVPDLSFDEPAPWPSS